MLKLCLGVLLVVFGFSNSLVAKEEPHHTNRPEQHGQHPNAAHPNANVHHNVNNANFHHVNGVNANPGVGTGGGTVVVPQTTTVIPVQDTSSGN